MIELFDVIGILIIYFTMRYVLRRVIGELP